MVQVWDGDVPADIAAEAHQNKCCHLLHTALIDSMTGTSTSLFGSLRKGGSEMGEPPVHMASSATYRGQHSACGEFASARFEPLPATGKETREIVRLWEKYAKDGGTPDAEILDLQGAAASETAFKRSAPGRRLLHLATHGFFLGASASRP